MAEKLQRGDQDRASETMGKWLVVLLRGGRAFSVASSRKGRCDQKSPANNQAFLEKDRENGL